MSYSTFSSAPTDSTAGGGHTNHYEPPPAYAVAASDSQPLLAGHTHHNHHNAPAYGYPSPAGGAYGPVPASSVPAGYQHPIAVEVCQPSQSVIFIGGCPECQVGIVEDEFTCLGILCAILFFPLGLVCCFLFTRKRCTRCGHKP